MLFSNPCLQAVVFPVVATFSGDSSRLLGNALKSNIHLLKVMWNRFVEGNMEHRFVEGNVEHELVGATWTC